MTHFRIQFFFPQFPSRDSYIPLRTFLQWLFYAGVCFSCCSQYLSAQEKSSGIIRGIVIDDSTGTPLSAANVFIANSTIGAAADSEGKFHIKGIPYGTHHIIASIVGYHQLSVLLLAADTSEAYLTFRLKSQNIQLPQVDIVGYDPVEWKKNLVRFTNTFFGSTSNGAESTILNAEVLDFTYDAKKKEFTATARSPLVIINRALGYRLHYYLKYLKIADEGTQYFGLARFEPLDPENDDEMIRWKQNRQKTYEGSKRHFFSSLFKKNLEQDGFSIASVTKKGKPISTRERMQANLDLDWLVTEGGSKQEKKFSFHGIIQIVYGDPRRGRVSYITLTQNTVTFFPNGEVAEPLEIVVQGFWATQRIAEILPSDYEP